MTRRIQKFLAEQQPATPCLVIDLEVVAENYKKLANAVPRASIYYAMKANPAPDIMRLLNGLGSSFDAASYREIEMALAAGATPDRISFGSTTKKAADVAAAHAIGVKLFCFDSVGELDKIAANAPGARVFCRILTPNEGAEWPLSRKFGCDTEMARELLVTAKDKKVVPWGVSFHVGSQQRDPKQWDVAIAQAAWLWQECEQRGVNLSMLNIGGGFPTRYRRAVPGLGEYGAAIDESLRRHFGNRMPSEIVVEPGRQIVGDAGIIQSEVVLISTKSAREKKRWVYLDIGKFGGLAETMDEAIQYPIVSQRKGPSERVIIAGPTCDSADVLYEKADYRLPIDLQIGDKVEIKASGAYTMTYASVGFNGFEPITTYCI